MNLNINSISVPSPNIGGLQPSGEDIAPADKGRSSSTSSLTVTESEMPRSELSVSEVPDTALDREDPLGNLVNAAFNLPPAMPNFTG